MDGVTGDYLVMVGSKNERHSPDSLVKCKSKAKQADISLSHRKKEKRQGIL